MTIRINVLISVTLLAALFVSGCTEKDAITTYDYSLSEKQMTAHMKAKGMDNNDRKMDRSFQSYIERNAIASIIYSEHGFDQPAVEVEVNRMRNELIIKNYIERQQAEATSEVALKKFYEDNIDKFSNYKIKVAQILFRLRHGMDQKKHDEKLKLANEVLEKLKSGAIFEDLVASYSDDKTSVEKGGEIGFLETGSSDRLLLDAVKKLNEGEISDLVTTNQGIHILKVLEQPTIEKIPFDQIKNKIEYELKYDVKLKELNRLKEKASAKISKDLAQFNK